MSDIVAKFDAVVDVLLNRRAMHRSYASVFGSPEGEIVLQHILKEGFVSQSTFVRGDPEQTIMNEGSRRMALSILRMAKNSNKERIQLIERELAERGIQI